MSFTTRKVLFVTIMDRIIKIKNVSENCKGSQRTRFCKIVVETFSDNFNGGQKITLIQRDFANHHSLEFIGE